MVIFITSKNKSNVSSIANSTFRYYLWLIEKNLIYGYKNYL